MDHGLKVLQTCRTACQRLTPKQADGMADAPIVPAAVSPFRVGGRNGRGAGGSQESRDSSSFYHYIPTSLRTGQPNIDVLGSAHSNTGVELRRPIVAGFSLPAGREQMLSSPEETSRGNLAGPGLSDHHFGTTGALGTTGLWIHVSPTISWRLLQYSHSHKG